MEYAKVGCEQAMPVREEFTAFRKQRFLKLSGSCSQQQLDAPAIDLHHQNDRQKSPLHQSPPSSQLLRREYGRCELEHQRKGSHSRANDVLPQLPRGLSSCASVESIKTSGMDRTGDETDSVQDGCNFEACPLGDSMKQLPSSGK